MNVHDANYQSHCQGFGLTRPTRALIASVFLATLSVLQGCSVLPGMFVVPSKPAVVTESPEEPASVDYTLLKVTPMLVRQIKEKAAAAIAL